jgi:hypothetical protein
MLSQLEGYCLRLGNREQEAELAMAVRRYSIREIPSCFKPMEFQFKPNKMLRRPTRYHLASDGILNPHTGLLG